jgi:DNA-binding SARP family transcriptional activator
MWFGILGPLLVHDGETSIDLPKGRQRVLLATLMVHAGKPVPADVLAEMVWEGTPPSGATVTLRSHMMRLRRVLGLQAGARLMTRYPGYLLRADDDEVDLLRFCRLCHEGGGAARSGAWEQAHERLEEALGLWRGTPLSDVPAEILKKDELPRLEELRLQALEWRIDAGLHLGRHAEMITELPSLTAEHPLRERFHGQLMLALYRCGRQAEALAAYQHARQILTGELGTEPGAALRELHQQILAADPALAAPEHPAPATISDGPATAVPRELPTRVRHFTGRTDELAALTGLLDQGGEAPAAVLITAIGGTAGVGKTALAVHWAHQVAARFPDGQLYVNLRGYDPNPPVRATDALAGFLRSLGVAGQDIPPEEDQRAARYRSILSRRQMLVLLDNAGSVEQVRPLLPGTPGCAVIVTSRDALAGLAAREGAIRLGLGPLPLADAIGLLRTLTRERTHAEPDAVAELAVQCCRLPLALRVAAELAATRPHVPLAELVGELADQQQRLDLLDAGGDPQTAVRTVFSWSYQHLDADVARTFRLLGLHPGPDFEPYAAAALSGTTVNLARRMVDVMARAQLIQPMSPGRYGMHDLLRAYARELAAAHDGQGGQQAALARLFDYYLHTASIAMDSLYSGEPHVRPRVPGRQASPPR